MLAALYTVRAESLIPPLATALSGSHKFSAIHVLILRGCRNLTKDIVLSLVRTLKEVRNLDLSFLSFIE